MKNNYISSLQFYSSMFLSSIISVLFISPRCSVLNILFVLLAVLINLIAFRFYNGATSVILKLVLYIYFLLISELSVVKLSAYMHIILESGPHWAIISIIMIVSYFCVVKGYEALSRASVIIGAFSAFFILYILIGAVFSTDYSKISFNTEFDIYPALIVIFPSVNYIVNNKAIKGEKFSHSIVFSLTVFIFLSLFILFTSVFNKMFPVHYLSKSIRYGVFKGGDCLLLALLTISVLYILGNSAISVCKKNKNSKFSFVLFLSSVLILSLVSAYFNNYTRFIINDTFLLIITVISILLGLSTVYIRKFKKNK